MGIDSLSTAIGEEADTIEDVYEPFLIMQGFLQRTRASRILTASGRRHLGMPVLRVSCFDPGLPPGGRRCMGLRAPDAACRGAGDRGGGRGHSQERALGLMGRAAMGADDGMLFVYPDEAQRSFWMKNTILRSIAFVSQSGSIVHIADMEPLVSDQCPRCTRRCLPSR